MSGPASRLTSTAYSARSSTYYYREFSSVRPGANGGTNWVEATGSLGAPFVFSQVTAFITVPSIGTSVRFGTATTRVSCHPSQRTTSVSFGTAMTRVALYPASRTSSVSFGAATTRVGVHPTTIPTSSVWQTPRTLVGVYPASRTTSVSFGAATTRVGVHPSSMPSGANFGVLRTRVSLYPASIPTSRSFGAVSAASIISPPSIATNRSFGALVIRNGQVIAPASLPTVVSFGAMHTLVRVYPPALTSGASIGAVSVRLGSLIRPPAIPTSAAFGAVHTAAGLHVPAIPSGASMGALSVQKVIGPPSIPTSVSFGSLQLNVAIHPELIPSGATILKFSVPNFAPLHVVGGGAGGRPEGPLSGGNRVAVIGGIVNMALANDMFTSVVLTPVLWVDAATSSGTTTPDPTNHQLVLDTGATPGSRAGVFCSADPGFALSDLDLSAEFVVEQAAVGQFGPVEAATLVLFVDHSGEDDGVSLRLTVRVHNTPLPNSRRVTEVLLLAQGGPAFELPPVVHSESAEAEAAAAGPVRLRLYRAGDRLLAFINGRQVADLRWTTAPVRFGLVASNASALGAGTLPSRVTTRLTHFLRAPVVMFGENPAPDLTGSGPGGVALGVVSVQVPPADAPGVVDVQVTGLQNMESLPGAYTYLLTGFSASGGLTATPGGLVSVGTVESA